MLGRYEEAVSTSSINAASYVNETIDSIKTVAALGRENEAMRVFDVKTRAAPKQWRYLVLGSAGFGMVSGLIMLMVSLLFYWSSRRLADGVVSHSGLLSDVLPC
jgi:ATP-binding cassette subfamily B (MDR/TAP) protein 1